MLLLSTRGPVAQRPAGTSTTPPPLAATAFMALLMAFVFSVTPSALAPWATMDTVSFLNTGSLTFGNWAEAFPYRATASTAARIIDDRFMMEQCYIVFQ